MALFKATQDVNLSVEQKNLKKNDEIELTVKRAEEINKDFKVKYPKLAKGTDLFVRVEEKETKEK
ncbi:hypothetical protein CW665_02500 [Macrococcoides caseolyticum]|uniref:hypothetical protein n=1 Tax=Macrococcoides caseolyticum TaxID=69966 RepID=UPI000C322AD0|nr:hypothetical protein [Macrococcus caseolyticus]PKE72984.1 hypothetical protein CW665_02500 [Macrococcus caseolyticus]